VLSLHKKKKSLHVVEASMAKMRLRLHMAPEEQQSRGEKAAEEEEE